MGESRATETGFKACTHCGVNAPVRADDDKWMCAGCGYLIRPNGKTCTCTGNKCVCVETSSIGDKIRTAARKLGFKVGV